jgi:hypothetical protein
MDINQPDLFSNPKEPELDWSWIEPYKKPLTRLFYRVLNYKYWKPDWYFGDNLGVFDPLLGGGSLGSPLKDFMNRVMDMKLSYLFKRPILDVYIFDDWLHEEFGNYENDGLSMKDVIELKFDQKTMLDIQVLIGGER